MAKNPTKIVKEWSRRHWLIRPLWRLGRKHRWLLRLLVVLPLALIALLITLGHSPLTRLLVVRELQRALNLDIQADSVYVALDGDLVIDHAKFRIPGIPGPAGQFLNVAHIDAEIDWWALCTGSPRVRLVTLTDPVVIVSQSTDDRILNLERLRFPTAPNGAPSMPRIVLTHAGIEVGEHEGNRYTPLKRVQMDGWFRPSKTDPGGFAFGLHEYSLRARRPGGPKEPGFVITGTRNQSITTVKVENFTLDDWPASSVPSPVRKQFESLDVKGDVPRAIFAYAPDTGFTAKLVMQDVAMNLPLEPDKNFASVAEGVQGPLPEFARLRGVSGEITFARDSITTQVQGTLEDLPYRVNLRYDGLTVDSPFTCEFVSQDFRVDKNPSLLVYAPPKAREWLKLFCGPTAVLTTEMTVRRGPPVNGQPAEPRVKGSVTLKEGTAAYARFPYEFRDMTGRFEFDNDHVKIVNVKGRSLSGGTMDAHGIVEPLDDTAEVTVDVTCRDVPIDEAMEEAFGPQRRQVLTALFNTDQYRELIAAGLVQTPAQALATSEELAQRTKDLAAADADRAPELRGQVAALEARVARPIFEFRGKADVDIHVHSPRGVNTEYQTRIGVRIPRAGLVPGKFPLPVNATDVTALIENDKGTLTGGTFKALGGGSAKVDAAFRIPSHDEPDSPPEITIQASELAFSPLLIHALPGTDAASAVKRILRDLNITGAGSGTVHIAGRPGAGADIGFDANFTVTGAGMSPAPAPGAGWLGVNAVEGSIATNESDLHVKLTGAAVMPDGAGNQLPAAGARLSTQIDAVFGDSAGNRPTTYTVNLMCPGLRLDAPAESIINVFSPRAALEISRLRQTYEPAGIMDIKTAATEPGDGIVIDTRLSAVSDLAVRYLDGDLALAGAHGSVSVLSAKALSIRCDDLIGAVSFDGQACGELRLNGTYPPDPAAPDLGLHARNFGLPIESALVGAVLTDKLSAENRGTVASLKPSGLMDADLTILPEPTAPPDSFPPMRAAVALSPHSLVVHSGDIPISFPAMEGRVEIDGDSGVMRGLTAKAVDWTVTADGAWDSTPATGFTLRTQLSGSAQKLTPELRAALPAGLRDIFDEIMLKVDGPMSLEEASLALNRGAPDSGEWTRFSGSLNFAGASMETGASISDLKGHVETSFQRDAADAPAKYKLDIDADSFRIGGVQLGRGHATVQNGPHAGELSMPEAAGECYGGRYAATAQVRDDGKRGHSFEVETRLSGVRFSPLMSDLSAPVVKEPETPEDLARRREDFSRGLLDGEISLGGTVGRSETRRGRGNMRVHGGRVIDFPFITRLIEVSNLALPGNARLDFARAGFFLEGGLITFTDISIFSASVQILGYGTMTWPGQVLDLRFDSRAARPVPLLSPLLQGIRDQLLTTVVTGKLGEQQVHLQQLPGPRRMIGRAVGTPETSESRRLNEIESRAVPQSPRPSAQPVPANPPAYGQEPQDR